MLNRMVFLNGIRGDTIFEGTKVMAAYEMTFVDSNFFVRLAKLAKSFGLTELQNGFFPHFHSEL